MRCRLFNILAAVSLVMCVATVALWVRSYERTITLAWLDESRTICVSITFQQGWVILHQMRILDGLSLRYSGNIGYWIEMDRILYVRGTWQGGSGIQWLSNRNLEDTVRAIAAHFGWLLSAFATLSIGVLLMKGRQGKRRAIEKHGLCLTCGYNLTGNVSGVCPECGTAIPRAPSKETCIKDSRHL